MFDIGWMELLLIGVVALIVVGPKDLPGMFRTAGQFTGRVRSMARDFQRAMEQAADESGVKEAAADATKGLKELDQLNFKSVGDRAKTFAKSTVETAEAEIEAPAAPPAKPDAPAATKPAKSKAKTKTKPKSKAKPAAKSKPADAPKT